MTIIGYARVSTEEQTLDWQQRHLHAAGCEKIFEDFGVSAVAEKRPGFDAAMAALSPGSTLVVWKLDRAFRSLKQALHTLEDFQARRIAFRSLTEHIDTSTPMGHAMFQIQNVFAELERKLISERTKAGLEAARRNGKTLGRRRKLTDEHIAWARECLYSGDATLVALAKTLTVSSRTLSRALERSSHHVSLP